MYTCFNVLIISDILDLLAMPYFNGKVSFAYLTGRSKAVYCVSFDKNTSGY